MPPNQSEPDNRLAAPPMASAVARMLLFERAASLLGGQEKLADALGIKARSLRAKFTADRGISDADLIATADALDARANDIKAEAVKIRALTHGG